MRRIAFCASAGVLLACLAGWIALAGAQQLPPATTPEVTPPTPLPGTVSPPPSPSTLPASPAGTLPPEKAPASLPVAPSAPATTPAPVTIPAPPGQTADAPPAAPASAPTPGRPIAPPIDEKVESSLSPDNPTGRQEPAVSLEWVGSPVAKVGSIADYSLVVRNTCNIPVQQVIVRVRVPAGLAVQGCEPKAATEAGGILQWDLGTVVAKQERTMQLKLQAETKGDLTPQAWVTFTGSSVMRIRVREPKLALKCGVSEKVLVGDPAAFTLTVSNPGDGSADQVKIHAVLSEGLEHARGNKIDFDIGNLAPGESRNVTLLCATRAGGMQKCEASADADGGLSCKDAVSLNVIMPRLDLQVSGPRLRYLERKAIYSLKVTNPGDAAASNVTVANMVPAGFKVLAASDGGRHDFQTRTVSWFLGEVGPGQTREVKLEVQAINPGDHKHKATAVGARGLRAEAEMLTKVEGLAALLVEMVDTEDPIEASGDTAYEVRITNTGSKTETGIKLVATIPDKMQFKNSQGPVKYQEEGRRIVFDAIEQLAPRADAVFRINVKALEAGIVHFKIQVSSASLVDPVMKEEATRIYADAPEPATGTSPAPAAGPAPTPPATGTPASVSPAPVSPAPAPTTPPASMPKLPGSDG